MKFQKAVRRQVKLKIALAGPSGSGKTMGALLLAKAIVKKSGGKIAVIDTEAGSASLYANSQLRAGDRMVEAPEFDTLDLGPPYTTARYCDAIETAIKMGYEVVIIDSATHQWAGEGGILSRKEMLDRKPGSNSYANWATFTPEHERFKSALLQSPIHLIACFRSKQDYVLADNDKGKKAPQKVGMAPVQRDGMEYEFTVFFDVDMAHAASTSKDRTGLFAGRYEPISEATGDALVAWLESGAEPLPPPPASPPPSQGPAQPSAPGFSSQGPAGGGQAQQRQPQKPPAQKAQVDVNRPLKADEFENIRAAATKHLWSEDQFFTYVGKKYGTVRPERMTLAEGMELHKTIVGYSGAEALYMVGAAVPAPSNPPSPQLPPEPDLAPPEPGQGPQTPPSDAYAGMPSESELRDLTGADEGAEDMSFEQQMEQDALPNFGEG